MFDLLICVVAFLGFLISLYLLRLQYRRVRVSVIQGPAFGPLTMSLASALPNTAYGERELGKDLVRSGLYHQAALPNYLAARNTAVLIWCLTCAAGLAFEIVESTAWFWALAGGGIIVIAAVPRVILSVRSNARAKLINHDLPDALDLLAMMMSGGMTMQESLEQLIGEFHESHPALADELGIISRQANAGTIDQALVSFADRLHLPEVTALTAMLRGGSRAGGSLVESLRGFADGLREARDQTARERGGKASIRLLFPVIFCLAPPIYVLLLGPAFLDLKKFVERENRPGGVLSPSVQDAQDGRRPVVAADRVEALTRR